MADDKRNGRVSLAAVLTVLGIIGGPLAVWGDSQLERGSTKEKITHIERRQDEDRRDTRQAITEAKEHIKAIDQNVQVILQTVKSMEAVQKAQQQQRGQR